MAAVGSVGAGLWLWLRTGEGSWAHLWWLALVALALLIFLGGRIGGRVRTR